MDSRDRHTPSLRSSVALITLLLAASVVYCLPLFEHLDWYGWQDWDQFTFRYETARLAIVRDHQWPVWNPYANGGTVLWAHPHFPGLSPWFGLTLALGAPLALRLQVVLFMALGAIGMAFFVRRLGAGFAAAAIGGIVFMMSAHYALHITEGHLEWTILGLMPWVALGLVTADEPTQKRRSLIFAALVFASAVTLGAIYVPAVFLLFFSIWSAARSVQQRRLRPLVAWMVVLMLTTGLAAAKLLPTASFVRDNPRESDSLQRTSVPALMTGLLHPSAASLYLLYRGSKQKDAGFDPQGPIAWSQLDYEYHEYGTYLGAVGLVLALLGVVADWRRRWPLYASGAVLGWMALGTAAPLDLWTVVQNLAVFDQLHVPSRLMAGAVFAAAVAAAFGCDALTSGLVAPQRRKWQPIVQATLLVVLYVELATMGHALFRQIFVIPPVSLPPATSFAQQPPPDAQASLVPSMMKSLLYPSLVANRGTLDGYENLSVPRGIVRTTADPGYRGEASLLDGGGTADIETWTMAEVRIRLNVQTPGTLVLNQNFDRGWRVVRERSSGATSESAQRTSEGLVGAPVDAGDQVITFRYWPPWLTGGLWLSAFTLLLCGAGLRRW